MKIRINHSFVVVTKQQNVAELLTVRIYKPRYTALK